MKDIILTIIAYFCAGGVLLFGSLFCACAVVMQRQEGEERRP